MCARMVAARMSYCCCLCSSPETLIRWLASRKGIDPGEMTIIPHEVYVQQQYDILAATMRAHMDMKKIYEILEAGI